MKQKKYIITILLFFSALTLCAQTWVAADTSSTVGQNPTIDVIVSNAQQYKYSIEIHGYIKDTIHKNNTIYEQISIADWNTLNNVGEPSLPVFAQFIGLPANKECTVTISSAEWITLPVGKIYPAQKSREESDTTEIEFNINDSIYNCAEYITEQYIISEKNCISGLYGVTLSIVPIKYYPSRNEIDILKSCVVTVDFTPSSVVNDNLFIKNKKLIKGLVDNYNEALINSYAILSDDNTQIENSPADGNQSSSIYDYLIITVDKYKNTDELKTFCAWKKIKGHNCKVVSCSEIGGNSPDSIKACIREWYEKGGEYVLFVGNNNDIPTKLWYYPLGSIKYKGSDYWYVCLDSDYFSDLVIGRFCINNATELYNIVSKTIDYENLTQRDVWVTKNLLIAHKQKAPKKYQRCSEEIRTTVYNDTPLFTTAYGAHDSIGGDNATNDKVVSYINEGFGIVNYRGHGDEYGWINSWGQDNKAFDIKYIEKLNNTKYPIVFSIACKTAAIFYSINKNCLLHDFIKTEFGAVAFLGSFRPIDTKASHVLNKYLYTMLYDNEIYEFSYLNNLAHMRNILLYPYIIKDNKSLSYAISNTLPYICGGDPSLEIWTDTISKFPEIDFTYENGVINIDTRTIEDYTITLFSPTDSSYFKKITVDGKTATISDVPSSFVMSINKHNYMPLVYNVSDGDIYMQNESYALVRELVGKDVYIGSNVTTTQSIGNVTIKSGAELYIDAKGKTIINKGVVIEKGAKVYIK